MGKFQLSQPILFVDEAADARPAASSIEYVGGPLARQRAEIDAVPEALVVPEGRYIRSVRCADDGALRYVWHPSGS